MERGGRGLGRLCRDRGPRSSSSSPGTDPLLHRNVQRFRGGLVFKAHRLVYHSTLDLRVSKKKKVRDIYCGGADRLRGQRGLGRLWHDRGPQRKSMSLKYEQLLHRNMQRFRGGLVFKAHRLSHRWRGGSVVSDGSATIAARASIVAVRSLAVAGRSPACDCGTYRGYSK